MGLRGWVKGLRVGTRSLGCLGFLGVLGFRVFGGIGCLEVLWCLGVLGCLGVTVKRLRV